MPDTWLRADYIFTEHRAIVTLATSQLWHVPGWKALLVAQEPAVLAGALTRLLATVEGGRYAGAVVLALRYDLARDGWQVALMHPSLAVVGWGDQAPEIALGVTTADLHTALEEA
jgi:hypothetical protein